jgi:hypothetical protein
MVDVLATVERVFAPLAHSVPDYRFEGFLNPTIEVHDLPKEFPGLPYAQAAYLGRLDWAGRRREEVFEGYEIRVRVFETVLSARAEAGEPDDLTIWRLVDSIMEYLPENLVQVRMVSWPFCMSGHLHPPEFRTDSNSCTWVCPASGEVVEAIAMVP